MIGRVYSPEVQTQTNRFVSRVAGEFTNKEIDGPHKRVAHQDLAREVVGAADQSGKIAETVGRSLERVV